MLKNYPETKMNMNICAIITLVCAVLAICLWAHGSTSYFWFMFCASMPTGSMLVVISVFFKERKINREINEINEKIKNEREEKQ